MGTSISAILTVSTSATGVPPGAATGLVVSGLTTTGLTLSWVAPASGSGPFSYTVQYQIPNASVWTTVNSTPQAGTTINITGLTPGTLYSLQVITSSPYPPSSTSAAINTTTLSVVLGAPTLSNTVVVGTTTAALSWTAPTTGTLTGTVYTVTYKLVGAGSYTIFGTTSGLVATVTGLTAGTAYNFQIYGTNAAGAGAVSNVVTATTTATAGLPSAPQNLQVTGSTSNTAGLSWTPPSVSGNGGTLSYTVFYVVSGSSASPASLSAGTSTTATVVGLQPSTSYSIFVTASNTVGSGPASVTVTATTTGTRSPFLQPGGNPGVCPWNTGIGSGAVFSTATDPATVSLTSRTNTVNGANFGQSIYVSVASDPVVTFTSNSNSSGQRDGGLTVSVHCPASAQPSPPFPNGDNQITIMDTTQSPATIYTFGPCVLTNGTTVVGGVTATFGEQDLICGSMADAITGNFGYDSGVGVIRAWELSPTTNPSGRIRHVLRFACDPTQILPPTAWDQPTNPTTGAVQIYWPQTHTDFGGPTGYTGKMPAGALVAIPMSSPQPSGLSAGGQMLFDQARYYGWMWRDTASGGCTLYTEPSADQNPLIIGMRGDLAKIVPLLRIVTNVGPTAIGGGGTVLDTNPAPLVDPGICGAPTAPGAPASLASSGQTSTTVSLTWSIGSGSVPQTFTVQSSPTGANTWTTQTTGLSPTSYTVTGLTASTGYDFRVSATNSAGTSGFSTITNVVTSAGGGGMTTLDPATSTMTLSLSNMRATSTGGGFQTARSTTAITSGSGKRQFEITMNTSSSDVAYGIINQNYVFNQASGLGGDNNGVGFYLTLQQGIFCGGGTPLSGNVSTSNSSNGDVATIIFDPSVPQIWCTSAAMRATGCTYNNSTTASPSAGTGGISLSGILNSGSYYICVNDDQTGSVSTLNTGNSAFSVALASGIVSWDSGGGGGGGVVPGQVTGLTVGNPTQSTLALSWTAPSTGTPSFNYTVQQATASGGPYTTIGTTGNTTFTANTLSAATTYYFEVFATNGYGTGTTSTFASGTTSPAVTTGSGNLLASGPLSTSGNQIVSSNGLTQRIAAVDWSYGYDRPPTLFGLNTATYQQNLDSMKAEGFNCVRLHTCDAGIVAGDNLSTSSYSATLNPGLVGKTLLQCYQLFMIYGASIGLRFIVDSHSNEGNLANQGNGLWYDLGGASNGTDGSGSNGTITDATFVSAWQTRATAFVGYTALLGYDIRNEPQAYGGQCTWGGMAGATVGSNTDIRDMYQRVGNAIHVIDSTKPLIICEGPQEYNSSFDGTTKCPEGDLTGVASYPVNLTTPNKVVYSVHVYPNSVGAVGTGSDTGSTAITRWYNNWGKVFQNGLGPIWVGECGTNLTTAADQAWGTTFLQFMNGQAPGGITLSGSQQGPGFGWYCWSSQADANAGNASAFAITTAYINGSLLPSLAPTIKAMEFVPKTSGPAPLITAPLGGTVNPGTFQLAQINGMYYWYLLPQGYSTSNSYPLLLCLHQLDQGNPFYSNGNNPNADIVMPQWSPWVNNVTFRTRYPSIVLLPLLDGTADTSGNNINWGGVSSASQSGQTNCIALVNYFIQNYSVYSNKVYVTGNSMGGIGSWDLIIKYNTKNPLNSKLFAAALILAGADYVYNYPNPTATMISNMRPVPIWAIHGAQDTQVPLAWDQNMYAQLAVGSGSTGATGKFYIKNGNIIHPNGSVFVPYGIALQTVDLPFAITNSAGAPLTTLFPNLNAVRLLIADYSNGGSQSVSYSQGSYANIQSYVNILTNLGIVVIINDGTTSDGKNTGGGAGLNYTSGNGLLSPMTTWYASLATGFLGNTYVWFGTRNEPPNNSQGALTIEQVATYNAIRGTGNNTIIEIEQIAGGSPSGYGFSPATLGANNTSGLYPNSAYNTMTNIIWGPHFYDWVTNGSTDVAYCTSVLNAIASQCQQISSADGQVPVFFMEYALSFSGGVETGGLQCTQAVQQSSYGALAWVFDQFNGANNLTNMPAAATRTAWGDQVAAWLAGTPTPATPTNTAGNMHYTQDASLGHDVWDTYYVQPTANTYWDWLFSQNF